MTPPPPPPPSYDSDDSASSFSTDDEGGDVEYTETNVLLGYATKEPTGDSISQLGGQPTWLESVLKPVAPSAALARCRVCHRMMRLLLQLDGDLPERFPGHQRRLYIFTCARPACKKKEGCVRAIRGTRIAATSPAPSFPAQFEEKDAEQGNEREPQQQGQRQQGQQQQQQQREDKEEQGERNVGNEIFGSSAPGVTVAAPLPLSPPPPSSSLNPFDLGNSGAGAFAPAHANPFALPTSSHAAANPFGSLGSPHDALGVKPAQKASGAQAQTSTHTPTPAPPALAGAGASAGAAETGAGPGPGRGAGAGKTQTISSSPAQPSSYRAIAALNAPTAAYQPLSSAPHSSAAATSPSPPEAWPAPNDDKAPLPPPYPRFFLDAEYEALDARADDEETQRYNKMAAAAAASAAYEEDGDYDDKHGGAASSSSSSRKNGSKSHGGGGGGRGQGRSSGHDQDGGKTKEASELAAPDRVFQRFADRVAQNSRQVLRYEHGGAPLLYSGADAVGRMWSTAADGSSFSSPFTSSLSATTISAAKGSPSSSPARLPPCANCGGRRVFELQLMPHAIFELESAIEEEKETVNKASNGRNTGGENKRDATSSSSSTSKQGKKGGGATAAAAADAASALAQHSSVLEWGTVILATCQNDCLPPPLPRAITDAAAAAAAAVTTAATITTTNAGAGAAASDAVAEIREAEQEKEEKEAVVVGYVEEWAGVQWED